ncbi:MAG: threonine synthase [Chloroflexota bacterium]|nr:MAG: threonine synthase [Chloroflexota bacterium]
MPPTLICTECHAAAAPLDWRCAVCGGPLDFAELPSFDPGSINADDFSLWRYAAMLPVERRFSLGEGLTPLVQTEDEGLPFHAKLEYLNPTGSYKDRGTVTLINHLLAHGVREVVEDSSGNAGASVAAYCTASDIHARIFVPASGTPAKKALIARFGGELVEIAGPQHAKTLACMEAAKTTTYASHAWSPYFVLGQMTVAWEVWEQMGHRAPDAVALPVGHGGLLLGFARGFHSLHQAGLIDRLPRLFAVQAESCDPIVRAWESGADIPSEVTPEPTVADGIIVEVPVRGKEVLAAIRRSNGGALRVSDEAILAAQQRLARRGLIVEPTSAAPVAALARLREILGNDASIVIPLTGNGLKMLTA